jgi:ElaB/YqjD/DUF883 family membrane-anchored ribosome-binding protein
MNLAEAHKKIRQLEDFIEELRKHHQEVLWEYAERQEQRDRSIRSLQSELSRKDQQLSEKRKKIAVQSKQLRELTQIINQLAKGEV